MLEITALMEDSMVLKKKAAEAIAIAMLVAGMTQTAQSAPAVVSADAQRMATETDLATNGMAGVAAMISMQETEAYDYIELASVEQNAKVMVTSAEDGEDVQEQPVSEETCSDAEMQPAEDVSTEEDAVWDNRLMADVNDFLYVRESADPNSEIVGKLYKGDVAEIQETGSEWTHVLSGNVDGYVSNDYCLTGTEALTYAEANFDTEAQVLTNGLRIRKEASADASVVTAVTEGTVLKVDDQAETDDEWVAVVYGGTTCYVSSDYVTTALALGEGITIEEEQAEQARIAAEEAAKKASQTTEITTVQKEAAEATADDVTLLAAIIQCEAGNEVYEGQLAVGAVVMNRVRAAGYPGSVYEVIYQKSQFPPAGAGLVAKVIAKGPKESCIQAAQEALGGADNTSGATCFKRASSGHAGVVIGNHVFY